VLQHHGGHDLLRDLLQSFGTQQLFELVLHGLQNSFSGESSMVGTLGLPTDVLAASILSTNFGGFYRHPMSA
jgi:hypothetical protein